MNIYKNVHEKEWKKMVNFFMSAQQQTFVIHNVQTQKTANTSKLLSRKLCNWVAVFSNKISYHFLHTSVDKDGLYHSDSLLRASVDKDSLYHSDSLLHSSVRKDVLYHLDSFVHTSVDRGIYNSDSLLIYHLDSLLQTSVEKDGCSIFWLLICKLTR